MRKIEKVFFSLLTAFALCLAAIPAYADETEAISDYEQESYIRISTEIADDIAATESEAILSEPQIIINEETVEIDPDTNENIGDIEITINTENVDIDNADVNETETEPSDEVPVITVDTETVTPMPEVEAELSDLVDKDKVSFSVTLPTTLALIVTDIGEVYSAGKAVILNNSAADVVISGFSVFSQDNWTLAPYSSSMSNVKVDSNLIGFSINGEETGIYGQATSRAVKPCYKLKNGTLNGDRQALYIAIPCFEMQTAHNDRRQTKHNLAPYRVAL